MNTYKKYKAESELGERLARTIEYILTDCPEHRLKQQINNAVYEYWKDILKIEQRH